MLDQLELVHMNGRIYDPLTARFMSADPLIQDPMNGQSYNRYSYVLNNPTNLTDPTGFSPLDEAMANRWAQRMGAAIADLSGDVKDKAIEMVNQMVNGDGRAAVNQDGNKQNGNGAVLMGGVGKDNSKMGGATNSGTWQKPGPNDIPGQGPDGAIWVPTRGPYVEPTLLEKGWEATKDFVGEALYRAQGLPGEAMIVGTFGKAGRLFAAEQTVARTAGEILAANRVAGKAAEALAKADLIAQGNTILGSQVAIWTSTGLRVIDHLVQTPAGQIIAYEVKAGNAVRNSAQIAKDAEIATKGGVLVGKNAPDFLRGVLRVIQTVEVRY